MRFRIVSAVLAVISLLAATYLGWCRHRISAEVFVHEEAWPRPWPYPDGWLERWVREVDAAHPAPPGTIKVEAETERVRDWLAVWAVGALGWAGVGTIPWVLWFWRRWAHRRRARPARNCGGRQ